ncbi:PQQ-binding-like beta-propeller repeat protein [Opitutales bacterium]|jgi:outer membrane protein assembly factor BamB|nr:PQQ-binding-like beta-propeller repeat protein [Opitutales bacterium]
MHRQLILGLTILTLAPLLLSAADESNWPQFRGSKALGESDNLDLPNKWGPTENVLWKRDIAGRGWSSPVVWGNRVFLTTAINEEKTEEPKKGLYFGGNRAAAKTIHRWKVLCLDLNTGEVLWEKLARKGKPQGSIHIKNSYATETPVTDGERVYAYFGNHGLYCYSVEGELLWSKQWPAHKTRYGWGLAASPILHEGKLYVVNDNEEQSYLVALDANTGKELWRTKRDEKSNWATPYLWENKQRTEIITSGTQKVRSYDLEGKLLYQFGGNSSITIATPYSKFDLLYVTSGYVGDRKKPIFAIRPGATGDISLRADQDSSEYVAWRQSRAGPYNPSTIVYGDLLYVLLDRGIVACYEAKTGKQVYGPVRLPDGRAFTSSPWAYNGKIFHLNEYGETYVLQAGRKYKLLHTNKLLEEDMCMATPAISGDKLIIRTDARVYCFKKGGNGK